MNIQMSCTTPKMTAECIDAALLTGVGVFSDGNRWDVTLGATAFACADRQVVTMQQQILWGERVAGAPYPFPVAELAHMPDDIYTYEIVEGMLIRIPGAGFEGSVIAARLIYEVGKFVLPRDLGILTGADGTYDMTRPGDPTDTVLVPDAAFVAAGRLSGRVAGYGKLASDLVAEAASPNQYHPEMDAKAALYIERGVRLAWIIWPSSQTVDVWRPTSPAAPVTTLSIADSLDGLDVLPGFTLPLHDLL